MRRITVYITLIFILISGAFAGKPDTLAQGFMQPPSSARPWVYWFWMNGNITREGISADLESMSKVGIGGALIMEVDQGVPLGPVSFASPKWRELFQFACSEAHRLGLEINMNDDAGWNGSGGPWITPDKAMQKLVSSDVEVTGPGQVDVVLPQPPTVCGYYRDVAILAFPASSDYMIPDINGKSALVKQYQAIQAVYPDAPSGASIPSRSIVNLTGQMTADGRIIWNAPVGKWTLLRLGHTCTGAMNSPSPESGRGLECDKLSKEGAQAAFDGFIAKLVSDVGPLTGETLVSTHIDSWENGSQNWTPRFREEFIRLRGYDPLPYLPTMTGRVVDSIEVSERFLWDIRQTVSDLINENYAGYMRTLAHRSGLRLSIEAYGDTNCDDMTYAGRADEPMAEFWSWPQFAGADTIPEMTSSAHIYGKKIIGAEAFTADEKEKWLAYPGNIKAMGDWAFTQGINRFVFHRYTLQPYPNLIPGLSMGACGLHYERTQTWWEQSKSWHEYLSRCQYMLRQGSFSADVLYLQAEGAPRGFNPPPPVMGATAPRPGYNYDGCTPEALLTRVSVRNGRLVLPDGMSYRALVLPSVETMTPGMLHRVKELVDAGAVVIGGIKPLKSPSLSGYPKCDADTRSIADDLWRSGKVITGKTVDQVLNGMGIPPDFQADRMLNWIHRRAGNTDIYFLANRLQQPVTVYCTFRVTGKQPQFWHADTGAIEPVAVYDDNGRVTSIPVQFDPSGSVFVVFRQSSAHIRTVTRFGPAGKLSGPSQTQMGGITILKALWGPAGDAARTKDVTELVKRMVRERKGAFVVADLVVEGDPAPFVVKTLRVDYRIGNRTLNVSALDPEVVMFELPPDDLRPGARLVVLKGRTMLEAERPGVYEAVYSAGTEKFIKVRSMPPSIKIAGPWEVEFDPRWGGPARVSFDKLISWSNRPEQGIKYYSGSAVYRITFKAPASIRAANRHAWLDLGDVQVIASVRLNGKDIGTLWKTPYCIDVTGMLRDGENTLELIVSNQWINRMIGDEELPEDSARINGMLTAWPDWVKEGRSNPSQRYTFTTLRLWVKGAQLQPSGLLGPVRIFTTELIPLTGAGNQP